MRSKNRPNLSTLFFKGRNKTEWQNQIHQSHIQHRYMLKAIADYPEIHYTTVNKVMKTMEDNK